MKIQLIKFNGGRLVECIGSKYIEFKKKVEWFMNVHFINVRRFSK